MSPSCRGDDGEHPRKDEKRQLGMNTAKLGQSSPSSSSSSSPSPPPSSSSSFLSSSSLSSSTTITTSGRATRLNISRLSPNRCAKLQLGQQTPDSRKPSGTSDRWRGGDAVSDPFPSTRTDGDNARRTPASAGHRTTAARCSSTTVTGSRSADELLFPTLVPLLDELTSAVLIHRPADICLFCAEVLEDKLERRKRKERWRHELAKSRRVEREYQPASYDTRDARISNSFLSTGRGTTLGMMTSSSTRQGTYASPGVSKRSEFAASYMSPDLTTSSPISFGNDHQLRTLVGHTGSITGVCTVDDYVITSSTDGTVRFWRRTDGSLATTLHSKSAVQSLAHVRMTQCQHLLLIGCCQGDVELFRGTLGQPISMHQVGRYPFHAPNPITTLTVSPDQHLIVTATCFRSYLLESRVLTQTTRGGIKLWNFADILDYANDDVIACGGQPVPRVRRTARQLGAEASTLLRISGSPLDRRVEDFGISSATFCPNSSILIVGFGLDDDRTRSWSKTILLCDVDSMHVLHVYNGMTSQIRRLVAIPAFCQLADTDDVIELSYFYVQTLTTIMKVKQVRKEPSKTLVKTTVEWCYTEYDKGRICCGMAISPDNTTLVSAHASFTVIGSHQRYTDVTMTFHDATNGRVLTTYEPGHDGLLWPSCFSADGSVLYAAASDHTIRCFRSARRLAAASPTSRRRNQAKKRTETGRQGGDARNGRRTIRLPEVDVCGAHHLPSPEMRHRCSSSNCFDPFGDSSLSLIGKSETRDSFENIWATDENSK